MTRRRLLGAGIAVAALGATPVAAATDPTVELVEFGSFDQPVDLAWRTGDPALYVVEQRGQVVRTETGQDDQVVLDLRDLVSTGSEQGLLGLAFSPDGTMAYVNYTDRSGATTVSEHPVAADGSFGDGDRARTVLYIEQPYENHNGGDLAVGPDGYLYVGMGDGGSGGDPERRATDPTQLLGKLLRIDPAIADGQPYTVPADNPFADGPAPEIWALGLRNPWRFSFDRETGDLWIADVGQGEVEEIDAVAATDGVDAGRGAHFGWSAFEGDNPFNTDVSVADPVAPVFTYGHDEGCSVSGGVRARGAAVGALEGWYVFGDFCATSLWALAVDEDLTVERRVVIAEGVSQITAVVDGPDGTLYALSHAGPVYRLSPPDAG